MSDGLADDPDLSATLLEQMFELWVEPELERRGIELDREGIHKALVVMAPGRRVETRINDEAELVARVRVTRPIEAGEPVRESDFDEVHDIRPHGLDPDAGWICFARLGSQVVIAFDFRRNRDRARRMLDRAREFLEAARLAQGAALAGPAIESGFAAAELSVVAQLLLILDDPPKGHPERRRWFVGWTELGNAPVDHSRALTRLAKERRRARYGEGEVQIRGDHLDHLLDVVAAIVGHAEARVDAEHADAGSQ